MKIRDLEILVSVILLVLFFTAALAGITSDQLGLHAYAYHKVPAYFLAAFAVVHLAFKWKILTGYLRARFTLKAKGGKELTASRAVKGVSTFVFWVGLWAAVFLLGRTSSAGGPGLRAC